MTLALPDLHNPDCIHAISLKNGDFIQAGNNQGFQVLDKWVELWQQLEDGRLMMVKRWRRYQSVMMLYF